MIKISKLADYGIVLLTCMANKPLENTYTARDLSAATGLPLPMVSKVLKLLARKEILDSQRGVKGGYSLSRSPEEISAARIIAALDGPIALTSCLDGNDNCCGIETRCTIRNYWELINRRIVDSLERVSLAEMIAPLPDTKNAQAQTSNEGVAATK
jgi:FeS assembly SUF system regulator